MRKKLRNIIVEYENLNWTEDNKVSDQKVKESDIALQIAEKERLFVRKRKDLIKIELKKVALNQQELGLILNHTSKSYMSELMNGLSPFSMKDLSVINRLLKIDLIHLIPTFLPLKVQLKIK